MDVLCDLSAEHGFTGCCGTAYYDYLVRGKVVIVVDFALTN